MTGRLWIRRVYAAPSRNDGYRVLVDRLWPRGVKREDAAIDEWCRDIAPSTELRRWFGHDPQRWEEFRRRYRIELADHTDELARLAAHARNQRVTLVYAAHDEEHNNAVVIREALRARLEQPQP